MILGINIEDFIFITIVLLLILTSIVTLLTISYKEKYMDTLNKAKKFDFIHVKNSIIQLIQKCNGI